VSLLFLHEIYSLDHLTLSRPHLGSIRKIHPGQKIHSSLLLSNKVYTPKARAPESDITFWDRLRDEEDFRFKWVEFDLYEHAANVMEDFIVDPDKTSHTLRSIAASSKPVQSFTNVSRSLRFCRRRTASFVREGY